jgi:hypothetical protein
MGRCRENSSGTATTGDNGGSLYVATRALGRVANISSARHCAEETGTLSDGTIATDGNRNDLEQHRSETNVAGHYSDGSRNVRATAGNN